MSVRRAVGRNKHSALRHTIFTALAESEAPPETSPAQFSGPRGETGLSQQETARHAAFAPLRRSDPMRKCCEPPLLCCCHAAQ